MTSKRDFSRHVRSTTTVATDAIHSRKTEHLSVGGEDRMSNHAIDPAERNEAPLRAGPSACSEYAPAGGGEGQRASFTPRSH